MLSGARQLSFAKRCLRASAEPSDWRRDTVVVLLTLIPVQPCRLVCTLPASLLHSSSSAGSLRVRQALHLSTNMVRLSSLERLSHCSLIHKRALTVRWPLSHVQELSVESRQQTSAPSFAHRPRLRADAAPSATDAASSARDQCWRVEQCRRAERQRRRIERHRRCVERHRRRVDSTAAPSACPMTVDANRTRKRACIAPNSVLCVSVCYLNSAEPP